VFEAHEQRDAVSLVPAQEPVSFEADERFPDFALRPSEPECKRGARAGNDARDGQLGFCLRNRVEHVPLRPGQAGKVAVYPREFR